MVDTAGDQQNEKEATVIYLTDTDSPPGTALSFQTSATSSSAKISRIQVCEAAIHRSKVLLELESTSTAPGQCTLPISSASFASWHSFEAAAWKQCSVEDVCTLLQVSSFLQDDATVHAACILLVFTTRTSLLDAVPATSEDTRFRLHWQLPWDAIKSTTAALCALPAHDLQTVISRFHLSEVLSAPAPLLRAWVAHNSASGSLDLSDIIFRAGKGDSKAFRSQLCTLWGALEFLSVTDVVLPDDFRLQCDELEPREEDSQYCREHMQLAADACSQTGSLPVLNKVTSVRFGRVSVKSQFLFSFLESFPSVHSLGFTVVDLPSSEWEPQWKTADVTPHFLCGIVGVLPSLPSLQSLTLSSGVSNPSTFNLSPRLCDALLHAVAQCSGLTEINGLDSLQLSGAVTEKMGYLRPVYDKHAYVKAIQWHLRRAGLVDTTHGNIAGGSRVKWDLENIAALTAVTSLTLQCGDAQGAPLAATSHFLNTIAAELQPLKELKQLRMTAGASHSFLASDDVTEENIGPFQELLERLDVFEPCNTLLPMICGPLDCSSVLSVKCSADELGYDTDIEQEVDSDESSDEAQWGLGTAAWATRSLSSLTALTSLSVDFSASSRSIGFVRGLAVAFESLQELRNVVVLADEPYQEPYEVSHKFLPQLFMLPKLEALQLVGNDEDTVGWAAVVKLSADGALPVAKTLTKLSLIGDEYNGGGVKEGCEHVGAFCGVLKKLTALKELQLSPMVFETASHYETLAHLSVLHDLKLHCDHVVLEADVDRVCAVLAGMTLLECLDWTAEVESEGSATKLVGSLGSLCKLGSKGVHIYLKISGQQQAGSDKVFAESLKRLLCGTRCALGGTIHNDSISWG